MGFVSLTKVFFRLSLSLTTETLTCVCGWSTPHDVNAGGLAARLPHTRFTFVKLTHCSSIVRSHSGVAIIENAPCLRCRCNYSAAETIPCHLRSSIFHRVKRTSEWPRLTTIGRWKKRKSVCNTLNKNITNNMPPNPDVRRVLSPSKIENTTSDHSSHHFWSVYFKMKQSLNVSKKSVMF